jgi:hypothetical protein
MLALTSARWQVSLPEASTPPFGPFAEWSRMRDFPTAPGSLEIVPPPRALLGTPPMVSPSSPRAHRGPCRQPRQIIIGIQLFMAHSWHIRVRPWTSIVVHRFADLPWSSIVVHRFSLRRLPKLRTGVRFSSPALERPGQRCIRHSRACGVAVHGTSMAHPMFHGAPAQGPALTLWSDIGRG